MTPVILVGENPLRVDLRSRPQLSLTGSSGQNLARMAGVPWPTYLRRTDRRNLFYTPVERWDARAARERAAEMAPTFGGRRVILLGAKVAAAFDLAGFPPYVWMDLDPERPDWASVALMPHPSGLNRVYNSPAERYAAGAFLREAMGL